MNFLGKYAELFKYEKVKSDNKQIVFFKKTINGYIVIEKFEESKYLNFYYNDRKKQFKESDLALAIINNHPVGWDEEKNVR